MTGGATTSAFSERQRTQPRWDSTDVQAGAYMVKVNVEGDEHANPKNEEAVQRWEGSGEDDFEVAKSPYGPPDEVPVRLRRSSVTRTSDIVLWTLIRKAAEDVSFDRYSKYMSSIMSGAANATPPAPAPAPPAIPWSRRLQTPQGGDRSVPDGPLRRDAGSLKLDKWLLEDASERLDETITERQAADFVHRYLSYVDLPDGRVVGRTVPYLDLIRHRLPEVGLRLSGRPGVRFRRLRHPDREARRVRA